MGNTKMRNVYKHLKHLVQKEKRKSYWHYTKCISTITAPDIKPNPKKLFSFLKATRKGTTGVPPLKHQGKTSNDTIDKANALNNQFQSVFTEDSENIMPEIGGTRYNTMNDINITLNGVTKLLKDLNPNEASGPDELTPRIL
jgi:hypothetical protein